MNNIIRKRVVITVEEKLKTIKELDASKLVAVMAKEYGVGQVMGGGGRGLEKKPKEYETVALQASFTSFKRKLMKWVECKEINRVLFTWFTQQKSKDVLVSGPVLQQKIKKI